MKWRLNKHLESWFPCTEKNMFDHHISSSFVCWVASLGKNDNFIAPEDCKHRNGLWFCAMDLHHAHGHDFHPKARQKLCRPSCSKHTEESQVAPGYRCFFFFGATFEFLMFNRRTQPSTGPLLCILFGIAQPRNWFFALSVSDSKISWRSLSHRWFNGERWPQTFVLKRWIESKCLKCLKFII